MTSSTPIPPEQTDEKGQPSFGEASGAKALAEVSEALNGLRELAERVTPPKSRAASLGDDMPEEQLALELPKDMPLQAPRAHIITVEEAVTAPPDIAPPAVEPRSIEIPLAPEQKRDPVETAAPMLAPLAPPPMVSLAPAKKPPVGETLREARLSAGFSLDDVAEEIKIKPSYLHAIEEGRYNDLPSRTYAMGFVRSYAQALDLHTDELVARCRAEVGAMPRTAEPLVMREPVADSRLPGGALMTVCVVLAVIAYAVSYSFLRPAPQAPALAAPKTEVAAASLAAQQQAPAPVASAPVAAAPAAVPAVAPAPVAQTVTAAPQSAPSAAAVAAPALHAPAAAAPDKEREAEAMDAADEANAEEDVNAAPPAVPVKKTAPALAPRVIEAQPRVIPGASAEDLAAMPQPITPPAAAPATRAAAPVDLNAPRAAPVKLRAPSRIKLRATNDTSVRIVDAQGKTLAERIIKRGESFYVPDRQHYTLSTSNAGALRLSVDGKEMPALGDAGEAMHNIPLDAGDLLQVLSP